MQCRALQDYKGSRPEGFCTVRFPSSSKMGLPPIAEGRRKKSLIRETLNILMCADISIGPMKSPLFVKFLTIFFALSFYFLLL